MELYEHNKTAYESALSLLEKYGKSAVVHPTGTGKSFIGLKLCEDNAGADICWLSPSEYIFKTQLENWKDAGGSDIERSVKFLTYARLTAMTESEIKEIKADYIVLDEFHRCGAAMWGQGVGKLLKTHRSAKVLGLSATSIRYLDDQRDMSAELFEGKIASYMTLGEAIARGILQAPKYVLSVYMIDKELSVYERRIKHTKSAAVRRDAERYMEALRRALEKADGPAEIFNRHMENRHGKYILFCSNYAQLCEMKDRAHEWFGGIDANPQIYTAYSENPETSEAFEAFKKDESGHIKLLYCIDMLNEGIHVEGVDGVVLLRPTVSPTVYKQQIGRALSAGRRDIQPVIFDIVQNIENLYSIGSIEEEIGVGMNLSRMSGEMEELVTERFKIVDEVKECRLLFERLSETLEASWDVMYDAAKLYFSENGDLNVPARYISRQGYSLGRWIISQRKSLAKYANGLVKEESISKVRADKLSAIGMRWESYREMTWERYFTEAKKYFTEHGNLMMNVNTKGDSGLAVGKWLAQLRVQRKTEAGQYLTPERMEALGKIGMIWDVPDHMWEQNYEAARRYYEKNGNLDVPSYYIDESGVRLGSWIAAIRNARKSGGAKRSGRRQLTAEQVRKLDEIGMKWEGQHSLTWDRSYEEAAMYLKQNGNLDIPTAYITKDGLRLGRWIRRQREAYRSGNMSEERRKKFKELQNGSAQD